MLPKKDFNNYFDDFKVLEFLKEEESVDYIKELVDELNDENQIMKSLTQEEIYKICDEGEYRYKEHIPPGYKDNRKDGIRKYGDLMLWKETIRYAKNHKKNIIFVSDDIKSDWRDGDNNFCNYLIKEFEDITKRLIIPYTSKEFYNEISKVYNINKTDMIEYILNRTDEDYCREISDDVYYDIERQLIDCSEEYINVDSANVGTNGIAEFDPYKHEYINYERKDSNHGQKYNLYYKIKATAISYDYWGKDEGEDILSDGIDHEFEGIITVEVLRNISLYDNMNSFNTYVSALIIDRDLKETKSKLRYDGYDFEG